jgi:hypothetical protein
MNLSGCGSSLEEVGPGVRTAAQSKPLLLLLALELLVVEVGGAALVRGELSGHAR